MRHRMPPSQNFKSQDFLALSLCCNATATALNNADMRASQTQVSIYP